MEVLRIGVPVEAWEPVTLPRMFAAAALVLRTPLVIHPAHAYLADGVVPHDVDTLVAILAPVFHLAA